MSSRLIRFLTLGMSVLVSCIALAVGENGAASLDPLDTPAAPSALAASAPLVDVALAGQRIVAVGSRGHIVFSDDRGRSWRQGRVPVDADLTAVSFPTPEQGWAVGHGGVILHTADAGQNWQVQQDGRSTAKLMLLYYQAQKGARVKGAEKALEDVQLNYQGGPEQPWLAVHFEDALHGQVIGMFNLIMRTEDGGQTWQPMLEHTHNPESLHLNGFDASGSAEVVASEKGTLFRHVAGGVGYQQVATGYSGTFFGYISGKQADLAYGLRGTIYRSLDHGNTWQPLPSGVSAAVTDAAVLEDGRFVLVTQSGQVLLVDASASSVTPARLPPSMPYAAVAALQGQQVVVVGLSGASVLSIEAAP